MAEEPRVRWATPQVLVPLLAVLAAGVYALRASPATVPPPPDLAATTDSGAETRRREVVLYLVDDGLAQPVVRELADPEDVSARLQAVVDGLREAMLEEGTWPSRLPAPRTFAFEVERDAAAVLDLPAHDVALDVAAERRIVASLQRTLLEQGIVRVAYLRDGRAGGPWLGQLTVPSSLD